MYYCWVLCNAFYISLEHKEKTESTVIELDNLSETEDDLDYIPPSPVSDGITPESSFVKTRSFISISLSFSKRKTSVIFVQGDCYFAG